MIKYFLIAALLAAGGCAGRGVEPAGTESAAPQGAAETLTAASAALQRETFRTTVDLGQAGTMTGVSDPAGKNGEMVLKTPMPGNQMTTTVRIVAGVTYVKVELAKSAGMPGLDGKKWRKIDNPAAAGSTEAAEALAAATEVRWVDGDTVEGTIDAAKSVEAMVVGKDAVGKMSSTMVPFEASFDVLGRLAEYRFEMPAIGSAEPFEMVTTYSDFGTPVSVKAPAAKDVTT